MFQTLITSRDPKGLQIASLFDATLNKAKLDQERAQHLIENGGKFQEGIAQLMNELSRGWTEKDGVICFSVTSDGTTGEQWVTRLEKKDFNVEAHAKRVLRSKDFKPTKGVTIKIEVLKGELFSDNDRIIRNICAEADKRKLGKPNFEIACLIREKFTDEEIEAMGLLSIVAMHEFIKYSGGDFLYTRSLGLGQWLDTCNVGSSDHWVRNCGFAFVVCK